MMASPTRTTDLADALEDFLADHVEIAERLTDAASDKGSVELQTEIQTLIEDMTLDGLQYLRVQHIVAAGKLTNWDELLLAHILRDPSIDTIPKVARRYSHDETIVATDSKNIDHFRLAIWKEEPVAVLLSAVAAGKILAKHILRDASVQILSTAVDKCLPLLAPELRALVFAPGFLTQDTNIKQGAAEEAYELTKACQRLHCIVAKPEHVNILLDASCESAHDIAVLHEATFVTRMQRAGVEKTAAVQIYNHATSIDCQNQEIWVRILADLHRDFCDGTVHFNQRTEKGASADTSGALTTKRSVTTASDRKSTKLFNLTEIFDLQSTPCEECCSVTSASAYFVDLLKFLRSCVPSDPYKNLKNALEVIADRRPDLLDLELSCANSKDMIQYITIVNEVLEAFIVANTKQKTSALATTSHDNQVDDTKSQRLRTPEARIASQLFPLNLFPFNQAADASGRYLATFGLSRLDIMRTFRSEAYLLKSFGIEKIDDTSIQEAVFKEVDIIYERAIISESLGLQTMDLGAIAKENIFPDSFFAALEAFKLADRATLATGLEIPSASTCWGYDGCEEMLDQSEGRMAGLGFIRSQFMPRSGLSFQDVLDLTNTLWFSRQLVITTPTKDKKFDGQLSEMRLHMLDKQLLAASKDLTNPPQKFIVPLSEDMCYGLQSFIRLMHRLGWTVRDLDATLSALASNQVANGVIVSPSEVNVITLDLLRTIAQVVSLSKLVGRKVVSLLPLWAAIDTHGPNSFYEKVFLGPATLLSGDDVFKANPTTQKFLAGRAVINSHLPALQAALKRSPDEIACLCRAAKIENPYVDFLTMDRLSSITRHSLMAEILGIIPDKYMQLLQVLPREADMLQDPAATLEFVTHWKELTSSGWSQDDIILSLQLNASSASAGSASLALALTTSVAEKLEALQLRWVDLPRTRALTTDDMMELSIQLWDANTAKEVVDYVEGSQTIVHVAETSAIDMAALRRISLPKQLRYSVDPIGKVVRFHLQGVLDEAILASLVEQAGACVGLVTAWRTLAENARVARNAVAQRLCLSEKDKMVLSSLDRLVGSPSPTDEAPQATTAHEEAENNGHDPKKDAESGAESDAESEASGQLSEGRSVVTVDTAATSEIDEVEETNRHLVEMEKLRASRRMEFVGLALPQLRKQYLHDGLVQSTAAMATDLEQSLLPLLLSSPIVPSTAEPGRFESAFETMLNINILAPVEVSKLTKAYFSPKLTNSYRFIFAAEEQPVLSINALRIPVDKTARGWESAEVSMITGQTYLLTCSHSLHTASWATSQQSTPNSFSGVNLLPAQTVESVASLLEKVRILTRLTSRLKLGLEDFKYLTSTGSLVHLDLKAISLADLVLLNSFRVMRDTVVREDGSLSGILGWLQSNPNVQDVDTIAAELNKSFIWATDQISTVLDQKYQDMPPSAVLSKLQDFGQLKALQSIFTTSRRIEGAGDRLLTEPVLILFDVAVPRPPSLGAAESTATAALQLCQGRNQLQEIDKAIQEKKRTILVQYLLQQEYVKNKGIETEDGLFEYFMIDVQMGPQLETTRMKQAISTIQLFVQRCLLNLETRYGMQSQQINNDKWSWMGRQATWQAARRAFLYPENWLEPSLRDDKTPLFEAFEASVMHKDLSWDSFVDAMRAYVQGLGDIADLRIDAYLREHQPGAAEVYHFFGRSRTAPFEYFYRLVRITRPAKFVSWTPWRKMAIDVTSHNADWDGSTIEQGGSYLLPVHRNGRLFLFLPQILVKAEAPKNGQVKDGASGGMREATFQDLANTAPQMQQGPSSYEVRMGWSELVNGEWTPNRVSDAFLKVDWNAAEPSVGLPSIANFVFQSSIQDAGIVIDVGVWKHDSQYSEVGRFNLNNNRIGCSGPSNGGSKLEIDNTLVPRFHKYSWKSARPTSDKVPVPTALSVRNGKTETPLLAIRWHDYEVDLSWTLSFTDDLLSTSSGLVVDEKTTSAEGTSVFMYPASEYPAPGPEDRKTQRILTTAEFHNNAEHEVVEHEQAQALMEAAFQSGSGSLQSLLDAMGTIPGKDYGKAVVQEGMSSYHELSTSYAIYNWELGLHAILMAVDRFHTTQQFELAIKAARLIFDPTAESPPGVETDSVAGRTACWKFKPFRDLASDKSKIADRFEGWPKDEWLNAAVTERKTNPSITHATARGRPQAYMKWIVLKYVQILCDAGDAYFRQGSFETLPLAIQRYVEAAHVMGPPPPKVPKLGKPKARTWKTLRDGVEVDLELGFPFLCDISRRGSTSAAGYDSDRSSSILGFLRTSYFCHPPNPQYEAMRSLVDDRLYKARNNLDINGKPIVYAMAEPYIDPGQMARALQSGGGGAASSLLCDRDSPMPFQRFSALIGKALELCNELRAMADQFLSVKEKQDSEAISYLKAQQDAVRQKMMMELKTLQCHEIDMTIESLQLTRSSTVSQLQYYLDLIGESRDQVPEPDKEWQDLEQTIYKPITDSLRMSPFELAEMISSTATMGLNEVATGMEGVISMLRAIPNVTSTMQPMGCGVTIKADAANVANGMQGALSGIKMAALISGEVGAQAMRAGNLTKQLQERRLQANIRGREIKSIDKQIEIQRKRREMNAAETRLQATDIDNAAETERWYRSKYTNAQLYSWFEKSLRTMHFELYNLAADLCRQAERAAKFEKGPSLQLGGSGAGGYWDTSRDGLLAAQQLQLSLRRLEAAYLLKPSFDFELTKNVSLRQLDPMALLALRETGTASFHLPEMLFDLDFPGHYMRRLRSVAVSIPCIIGPYTTLAATLSLTQHQYRVSGAASSAETYVAGSIADGTFRTDSIPITQVAISSGMQDAGTFELNFRPDSARFHPFEGAGAISTWKLELPAKAIRQFNYETISDVVLHVRYTAQDGGPILKRTAYEAVAAMQKKNDELGTREGLWGYLDIRNDLSSQWHAARSTLASNTDRARSASIDLHEAMVSRLPFWCRDKPVQIESAFFVLSGDKNKDPNYTAEITCPALAVGDKKLDRTPMGKKTMLSSQGTKADLNGRDWRLVFQRDKGQLCGVQDVHMFFRYFLKGSS